MNPPLLLKVKNLKVKKTRQMRKLENYNGNDNILSLKILG